MIYFILFCFFVYVWYKIYDTWFNHEFYAMLYVGGDKLDQARNSMSEKEFKKYINENSKLMKKALNERR